MISKFMCVCVCVFVYHQESAVQIFIYQFLFAKKLTWIEDYILRTFVPGIIRKKKNKSVENSYTFNSILLYVIQ